MRRHWGRKDARSGMSLLLVLTCLIVVTTIVGAMLRNLILVNRQAKQQMRAAQAAWLAESGIERAAYFIRRDPNYHGETWKVNEELFGSQLGQVEIQIDPNGSDQDAVVVHVVATFPYGATLAVKARRKATIAIAERATTNSELNGRDDHHEDR